MENPTWARCGVFRPLAQGLFGERPIKSRREHPVEAPCPQIPAGNMAACGKNRFPLRFAMFYGAATFRSVSMLPCRFSARVLVVAGLLTLSLTACGRRGAPEPPPDPSAPKTVEAPAAGSGVLPSPVGHAPLPARATGLHRSQGSLHPRPDSLDPLEPMHHFAYRDGVLHAEDVDLRDVAATPSARRSTAIRPRPSSGITGSSARPSPTRTPSSATP